MGILIKAYHIIFFFFQEIQINTPKFTYLIIFLRMKVIQIKIICINCLILMTANL